MEDVEKGSSVTYLMASGRRERELARNQTGKIVVWGQRLETFRLSIHIKWEQYWKKQGRKLRSGEEYEEEEGKEK